MSALNNVFLQTQYFYKPCTFMCILLSATFKNVNGRNNILSFCLHFIYISWTRSLYSWATNIYILKNKHKLFHGL